MTESGDVTEEGVRWEGEKKPGKVREREENNTKKRKKHAQKRNHASIPNQTRCFVESFRKNYPEVENKLRISYEGRTLTGFVRLAKQWLDLAQSSETIEDLRARGTPNETTPS